MRLLIAAASLIALTACLATLGSVTEPGEAASPRSASPSIQPVSFTSVRASDGAQAPVAPDVALSQVEARLGASSIIEASIANPPSSVAASAGSHWFYATLRIPGLTNGLGIEPAWEADLLEGAVAELSGTSPNLRSDLDGASFSGVLPSGETVAEIDAGMGDVARGQKFSSDSSVSARADVKARLVAAGLTPIDVQIYSPLGPAPLVIAAAADPRSAAAKYRQIVDSVFGDPPKYEGYYIELRDNGGSAFIRASAAFRTGAGRCWIDDAYKAIATLVCGA